MYSPYCKGSPALLVGEDISLMSASLSYDIIIVGAGPAGLAAAHYCCGKGYRVLLLEKERRLGQGACGEVVAADVLRHYELEQREEIFPNRVDGTRISFGNDGSFEIGVLGTAHSTEGYVLDKQSFLENLAGKLGQQEVDVFMGASTTDFSFKQEGTTVDFIGLGGRRLATCGFLIGADGARSMVSQRLLKNSETILMRYVFLRLAGTELDDPEKIILNISRDRDILTIASHVQKESDTVNSWMGTRRGSARHLSDSLMQKTVRGATKVIATIESVSVINLGENQSPNGRAALCGEAAGYLLPLMPAGIQPALLSGVHAGKQAHASISNDSEAYEEFRRSSSEISSLKQKARRCFSFISSLESMSEVSFEKLSDFMSANDVEKLSLGDYDREYLSELQARSAVTAELAKNIAVARST